MKIEVVPYNPRWPADFDAERLRLKHGLGDIIDRVHHIGSTAVEGLAAKPVIDMILEVGSLGALDDAAPKLESMGYEAMGEFGIPGRRYFRKGGFDRTHQIHAFESGDSNVLRHLAFRDYLKAHPDVLQEYAELKRMLAKDCNDDIETYCDGKDAFVKHHEAEAVSWATVGLGATHDR